MTPIGLGFRAGRGGSVVVGVAVDSGEPRVVLSRVLETATEGDRLSFEPYHVASEMERGPDGEVTSAAAAAVAEGRERQERLAAQGLADIIANLRKAGFDPAVAALLVNRAGWITDLLGYSLEFKEHAAVAEGLAVRDALRFAFGRCGIELDEADEKSLHEVASGELGLSSADIDVCLGALGASAGRPWRKEQKLAALAAWVAIRRRGSSGR